MFFDASECKQRVLSRLRNGSILDALHSYGVYVFLQFPSMLSGRNAGFEYRGQQCPEYYEAASIDGANKKNQFLYITLPLLKGIFRTNIIMWSISVSGFFLWSKLFSPISADTSTVVPMVYMYEKLFGAENTGDVVRDAGISAAIGVMLCLFIVAVFTIVNRFIKDDDLEF